jgi:hypothetical protein
MIFDHNAENTNPPRTLDEQGVRFMHYLFVNKFCPENEIPREMRHNVLPLFFTAWLSRFIEETEESSSLHQLLEAADVSTETWEYLKSLLVGGAGVERIMPVWYYICLGDRPTPVFPVRSLTLLMMLQYEDGTIYPEQIYINSDMNYPVKFTDGMLAALVSDRARKLANSTAEQGIDGMHSAGANYGGPVPFHQLMGAILQFAIPAIAEEKRAAIMNYVRLCQGIIEPAIPPAVKAQIAARKSMISGNLPVVGGLDA